MQINDIYFIVYAFIELKSELEKRYTTLEELQKNGNKYNQQEIEKELAILERLQYKYNKIDAKRKKLAKQNYEQVNIDNGELFYFN